MVIKMKVWIFILIFGMYGWIYSNEDGQNSSSKEDNKLDSLQFCCDKKMHIWSTKYALDSNKQMELFYLGRCLTNSNSFEAVWVLDKPYRKRVKYSDQEIERLFKINHNSDKDIIIDNFKTYIFKMKMDQIDDPIMEIPYTFPTKVIAYKFHDNKFLKCNTKIIQNFDGYENFKCNTVLKCK